MLAISLHMFSINIWLTDESYGGKQLRRGYWDMARTDDRLPPIGHVVFVIHGIGQCMEGADICKATSEYVCCLLLCVYVCVCMCARACIVCACVYIVCVHICTCMHMYVYHYKQSSAKILIEGVS